MAFRHQHGFTLIELMVVILIIGILGAMGTGLAMWAIEEARITQAKALVESVEKACETYKLTKYNYYPANSASGIGDTTPLLHSLAGQIYNNGTAPRDQTIYLKLESDAVTGAAGQEDIVDPWQQPLYYANWLAQPATNPAVSGMSSTNAKHKKGVDVWSIGPDGTEVASTRTFNDPNGYDDDVTNWTSSSEN